MLSRRVQHFGKVVVRQAINLEAIVILLIWQVLQPYFRYTIYF